MGLTGQGREGEEGSGGERGDKNKKGAKGSLRLIEINQLSAAVVHDLHQTEYTCEEEDLEAGLVEDC